MKKFFVCLMCCFGIFTLCSATSTVGDVYLNEFDILVNGEEYSPTLPVLNYQGRTYLPLNEFGSMTGNDIDFADNTIFVRSKYQELFYLYTFIDDLYDNINNLNEYASQAINYYYFCYKDASSAKTVRSFLGALRQSKDRIDTILQNKIVFVRYCLSQNLLTIEEADKFLQDIETIAYDFSLIEKQISYYLDIENYTQDVTKTYPVALESTNMANTEILKMKLEIAEKFD